MTSPSVQNPYNLVPPTIDQNTFQSLPTYQPSQQLLQGLTSKQPPPIPGQETLKSLLQLQTNLAMQGAKELLYNIYNLHYVKLTFPGRNTPQD